MTGSEMHQLCRELFPICRSLTGNGVRQTLRYLKDNHLPPLSLHEVSSGTKCFDWTVPKEWNIEDAYVLDPDGKKIIDFKKHNLHVVGSSIPVDTELSLEELDTHLHSLPEQPDAIPFIASHYVEYWGFCLTHRQRLALKPGKYRAVIKSRRENGSLTYGELLIPGKSKKEIFISTYVCHPSMANNELSGPACATALGEKILAMTDRRYSYRLIFIPETIGSIVYLSKHIDELKEQVIAGFNLTCIGDERATSFLPSRAEDTLADRVAKHVLRWLAPDYIAYSFLDRGSDERQYCSPGADLPVVSIMRSRYGTFPEYHTSLDDLDFVTPAGLQGGYDIVAKCLDVLEANCIPRTLMPCEPQLGKRGLYPALSTKDTKQIVANMMNLIAYSDGTRDLLAIADKINVPVWEILPILQTLEREKILSISES